MNESAEKSYRVALAALQNLRASLEPSQDTVDCVAQGQLDAAIASLGLAANLLGFGNYEEAQPGPEKTLAQKVQGMLEGSKHPHLVIAEMFKATYHCNQATADFAVGVVEVN